MNWCRVLSPTACFAIPTTIGARTPNAWPPASSNWAPRRSTTGTSTPTTTPSSRPIPACHTIKNIHPLQPAEGWTAVCPTQDHATQYGLEYRYPNMRPWYTYLPVKERVGTIDLMYLAPGSLDGKK